MDELRAAIDREVAGIRERKGLPEAALADGQNLLTDGGLDSLDVAELVSRLEVALGVDPFAEGATARDYGEFVGVYAAAVGAGSPGEAG